jgi:hypothetical protein
MHQWDIPAKKQIIRSNIALMGMNIIEKNLGLAKFLIKQTESG